MSFSTHIAKSVSKVSDIVSDYNNNVEQYGKYQPTLLVGLGGTGAKILQRVRRLTIERFGSLDALPAVRYLSIDTDVMSEGSDAQAKDAALRNPVSELIRFQPSERIQISAPLSNYMGARLLENAHIARWLDPDVSEAKVDFPNGAGQIRPAARLALFHNMNDEKNIRERLQAAISSVHSQDIKGERIDTGKTLVIVCGSLAGGTGAGCFLDIGAAIRIIGATYSPTLIGMFVLPDVFQNVEPGKLTKLRANGMACLTELNHFATNDFVVQWNRRVAPETVGPPLYNHVYLFDGVNEAKKKLVNPDDAYRIIGDNIFSEYFQGNFAGVKRSARVNRVENLAQEYAKVNPLQGADGQIIYVDAERYPCRFQSFGLSRVAFPAWRLLNASSYQLAAELVNLLDNPEPIRDNIVPLCKDFAEQVGFYQGEEGLFVCRRLERLNTGGANATTTLRDEVASRVSRLVEPQVLESLRAEKATRKMVEELHAELSRYFGNFFGEERNGPGTKQIETNQESFYREVEREIPLVIEKFCDRPSVGPTRIAELMATLSRELLGDSPHYRTAMGRRRLEAERERDAAEEAYKRALSNAVDGESWFVSKQGYADAMKIVAERLEARWVAAYEAKVFEQAEHVLGKISALLMRHHDEQVRVGEEMRRFGAQYLAFAEYYKRPDKSAAVTELDPQLELSRYLEHYLGTTADERRSTLSKLFSTIRGRLELRTNGDLLREVLKNREKVAESLRVQCWKALRGEDGFTPMFLESDGTTPKKGFIEQYSVLKIMKQLYKSTDSDEIAKRIQETFVNAQPWIQPNEVTGLPIVRDCFVGISAGDDVDARQVHEKVKETLRKISGASAYKLQEVGASDPSEIIIYTEVSAFIPGYLSSLTDMNAAYETQLKAGKIERALHLFKDHAKFARLKPISIVEIDGYKDAWKLFLLGVMLGKIRSRPQELIPDQASERDYFSPIFAYPVESHGGRTWRDLGIPSAAAYAIAMDNELRGKLDRLLTRPLEQVEGFQAELIALARYYRFCIFPALSRDAGRSGYAEGAERTASIAYLALLEIEREHSGRVMVEKDFSTTIDERLKKLATYTQLTGMNPKNVTALAEDHGARFREEISIDGFSREDLKSQTSKLVPPGLIGAEWRGNRFFPWLALDLDALAKLASAQPQPAQPPAITVTSAPAPEPEAPAAPPAPVAAEAKKEPALPRFHYNGGDDAIVELEGAAIVSRIKAEPNGSHRVWRDGMSDWASWKDVPVLSAAVTVPPPLPKAVPPPLPRPQPPPLKPLPPPVVPEEVWFYSINGENVVEIKTLELLSRVKADPTASHRVWKEGMADWADWHEVPTLKAIAPGSVK